MKSNSLCLCLLLFLVPINLTAQNDQALSNNLPSVITSHPFVAGDIFQTGYFIENKGQFNKLGGKGKMVKFGVDKLGEQFYFHQEGFSCIVQKGVVPEEDEEGEKDYEEEDKESRKIIESIFFMQWIGANPNPLIETQQRSGHYFTYGGPEYNSYGYKKIVYTDLYPHIDVVYEIPEKGGIKYSIIVKPGGDLSRVKFKYTGDKVNAQLWSDRLLIKNPVSDYAEESPHAFEEGGQAVDCRFKIKNKEIFFEAAAYSPGATLIIDPWVAAVTTLTSLVATSLGSNRGYDVDFDYAGNLYVYGGAGAGSTDNPKIAKYDLSGNLVWTFSGQIITPAWQSSAGQYGTPSNFVVEKSTGSIYTGQAYSSFGTRIIRLNTLGNYDNFISTALSQFEECWDLVINCSDPSKLGVVGGGTNSPLNIGWVDIGTGTASISNFTGWTNNGQDIANIVIDNNSFGYVIFGGPNTVSALINHIFKLEPTLLTVIWDVPSGYLVMQEGNNHPFMSFSFQGNGINVLAANATYLFYYDGENLKAFSKVSGAVAGLPLTISTHVARYQSGIYADECNNVYVGGAIGNIKVYSFNGSSFIPQPDIVLGGAASGNSVHDIRYHTGNNLMYVSGKGFAATVFPSIACSDTAVLNISLSADCQGNATVTVIDPDVNASYTYIWRDSASASVIQQVNNVNAYSNAVSGLAAGIAYSITVIKNALCGGASAVSQFRISGALINIPDTAFLCSNQAYYGQYFSSDTVLVDTLSSGTGCDSIVTTQIRVMQDINWLWNVSLCPGQPYLGQYFSNDTILIDTFTVAIGCDSIAITQIQALPASHITQDIALCPNETYKGLHFASDTTLTDSLSNAFGCDSIVTTQIHALSTISTMQNVSICDNEAYRGQYFTADTALVDTLLATTGCDSIVTTQLHVHFTFSSSQNVTLCSNEIYQGQYFNNDTSLMAIMSTVDGCDSMVITLVHVLPVSSTDIHVSICANETYQGQYFSRDTSFISAILSSLNGCDSMITTKIHVFPAYNTTQNIVLCAEEKYLGQYFASDTSWVNTWISTDGCDSMLTTLVHVLPFNATLVNAEICFGQLYGFNGNNYDLSGTYIDTLTNSAGCDSVLMLNLHVLPDIGLYAVPDEATLELGEGIGINIFNSPLANIVSYSWSPGLGVSCPDCSSALLVPLEDTRYMVVAFDASGCRDTVFIPVLVNGPVIFVPNVFTPNGDGNNDYFEFFGSKKAVNFLEVKIFDRWGDKVFESNDLDFKWDGTYKRQLLPPAVFVYTLRVAYIDGYPEKMFKGSVTLLR